MRWPSPGGHAVARVTGRAGPRASLAASWPGPAAEAALRYSADRSPPLLIARARGDRVELRVADRGPGGPEAARDQMFAPFQRLSDTGSTGVGLGLTLSRGLAEAMRGTLEPEQTAGGGLTMAISVPAIPGPARAFPGSPGRREREPTGPTRRQAAITTAPEHGTALN